LTPASKRNERITTLFIAVFIFMAIPVNELFN